MFEKIRSYLASELDISEDEITRDTTFESLGVDSLRSRNMLGPVVSGNCERNGCSGSGNIILSNSDRF